MNKMLMYFILPLIVSFRRNWQLKVSNFEKNVTFPDIAIDGTFFSKILTYIHMTHVNYLLYKYMFFFTYLKKIRNIILNITL